MIVKRGKLLERIRWNELAWMLRIRRHSILMVVGPIKGIIIGWRHLVVHLMLLLLLVRIGRERRGEEI